MKTKQIKELHYNKQIVAEQQTLTKASAQQISAFAASEKTETNNKIKLCLKLHKQYIADIEMVTGVTTNMSPNLVGAAVVPTQLKETPIKSDRRVSVKCVTKKVPLHCKAWIKSASERIRGARAKKLSLAILAFWKLACAIFAYD